MKNLGTKGYLSLLKYIDGVIGNSSSGISEVPLFSTTSINLGDRQKGRDKPSSVISCKFKKKRYFKKFKKTKKEEILFKN